MKPTSRVTHQGNHGGIITTRNPLAWDRGSPLGMNSRPRDLEDTIVFDSLDGLLYDLSGDGLFQSYPSVGEIGAFGIPNPFTAVANANPLKPLFDAPKMIGIGLVAGLVIGGIIGYKLGS